MDNSAWRAAVQPKKQTSYYVFNKNVLFCFLHCGAWDGVRINEGSSCCSLSWGKEACWVLLWFAMTAVPQWNIHLEHQVSFVHYVSVGCAVRLGNKSILIGDCDQIYVDNDDKALTAYHTTGNKCNNSQSVCSFWLAPQSTTPFPTAIIGATGP